MRSLHGEASWHGVLLLKWDHEYEDYEKRVDLVVAFAFAFLVGLS